MSILSEWEEFYGQYRKEGGEADQELEEMIDELFADCPEEMIDTSDNVCVLMDSDEWDDVLDFLEAVGAPIPNQIISSPMHADPREMDNQLETYKRQ